MAVNLGTIRPGEAGYVRASKSNNGDVKTFSRHGFMGRAAAFIRDPSGKKSRAFKADFLNSIEEKYGADYRASVEDLVSPQSSKPMTAYMARMIVVVGDKRTCMVDATGDKARALGALSMTGKELRKEVDVYAVTTTPWAPAKGETSEQAEAKARAPEEWRKQLTPLVQKFAEHLVSGQIEGANRTLADVAVSLDALVLLDGPEAGRAQLLEMLESKLGNLPKESLDRLIANTSKMDLPSHHPLRSILDDLAFTASTLSATADKIKRADTAALANYIGNGGTKKTSMTSLTEYSQSLGKFQAGLLEGIERALQQCEDKRRSYVAGDSHLDQAIKSTIDGDFAREFEHAIKTAIDAELTRQGISVCAGPGPKSKNTISPNGRDFLAEILCQAILDDGYRNSPNGYDRARIKPIVNEVLLAMLAQRGGRPLVLGLTGSLELLEGTPENRALIELLQPLVNFTMLYDKELREILRSGPLRESIDQALVDLPEGLNFNFEKLAVDNYAVQSILRKITLIFEGYASEAPGYISAVASYEAAISESESAESDPQVKQALEKGVAPVRGKMQELMTLGSSAPVEVEAITRLLTDQKLLNKLPQRDRILIAAYGALFEALLGEMHRHDGAWKALEFGSAGAATNTPVRTQMTRQFSRAALPPTVAHDDPPVNRVLAF